MSSDLTTSPASELPPLAFNPLDPGLIEDPHPAYRNLLDGGGAHYVDALGLWVVTSFDGVWGIVRDRDAEMRFVDFQRQRQGPDVESMRYCQGLREFVLAKDGDDHRRIRGAFARRFTGPRVAGLRDQMLARAHALVDGFVADGEVELMEAFAMPLPLSTISELLGVPESADAQIAQWVHDFKPALQFLPMGPEELAGANAAVEGLSVYFSQLIADRRAAMGDDLLSALISEADAGNLSEPELVNNAWALYVAGHETSASSIGNALITLFRHPDQLAALVADPSLTPRAVEEVLRFESPGQANFRVLPHDTQVGEQTIPAGSPIVVYFPAANRDPHRFTDPDRFDITREDETRHIAFSSGPHVCPGQHLARQTLSVALEVLLQRLPGLHPVEDQIDWHPTPLMRGPARLKVAWDAAR